MFFIKCQKKNKQDYIKGERLASFLTAATKFVLVAWIGIVWLIKLDMDIFTQILLLGVPFSLIYVAESYGIWDAIKSYFQGLCVGGVIFVTLQILRILTFSSDTIFFLEKIISTITAIYALKFVNISGYKEWYRKTSIKSKSNSYTGSFKSNSSIYSTNSSSTYNTSSSSSTNSTLDLFGANTRVEYNYLTGSNEYYQNGRLVARGEKSPFSGNENIYDTKGNKIFTKEQGLFDDYVYKENMVILNIKSQLIFYLVLVFMIIIIIK